MHYIPSPSGAAAQDATLGVHNEGYYSVQNTATDGPTAIYAGPALLLGVYINTTLSAHTVILADASTTVVTIPASLAAGTSILYPGIRFETSLQIDPDNSSTGNLTVVYRPL
jgi:hypothetical protein